MDLKERRQQLAEWWRSQGLSTRAANSLARRGLVSWDALAKLSMAELLSLQGIGETTAEEIRKKAVTLNVQIERKK